jgi:tRNA threonylcarbamoyladenosine biosynthesis protein TsaB
MRLLLIHTSGSEASVALADTSLKQAIVATEALPGRTSSERLVPTVRRLMASLAWKPRELTALVVVHGPGSFTGVRVGLSAAKGISEAAGVPLIAVSRLALLAAAAGEGAATVHAVLDAGRGESYYGEYSGHCCVREALLSEAEVKSAANGGIVVVCEAKVAEALPELHPRIVQEPSAGEALPFAIERIAAGDFDDVAKLDANYLRRTDAEIFAKPKAKSAAE